MLPSSNAGRGTWGRARAAGAAAVGLLTAGAAGAADWPGWLGPTRDAVWREAGVLDALPAGGPKVVWRAPIGAGYAGPAVAGGRVYVMDRQAGPVPKGEAALGTLPGTERVVCLDARTGARVWAHEYDCPYTRVSYPQGPRTTPVVDGDKVYTLGTMGDMLCLDKAAGKVVWARHLMKDSGVKPRAPGEAGGKDEDGLPRPPVEYNVMPPVWGFSAHLLLDGDNLITLVGGPGGAVRAFSKRDGKEVWKALTDREVCYAPPVVAEAGGVRQVVAWTASQVAGLDPATGAVLWRVRYPDVPADKKPNRPGQPGITIATPRVAGDLLFVSSIFDGCMAVRLDKGKPGAAVAWAAAVTAKGADKLPTLMTTLLVKAGHLYGVNADGAVECRKADTGEEVWKDPGLFRGKQVPFASAFWVENGNNVWALTDLGDLVLLRLSPKGYEELGRAHVIEPTLSTRGRKAVWSHPAFADRCMVARNDKEIICLSLAKG